LSPIDIDYEYPQKQPDESAGFISFLKALREKFPDKEISVAVSGLPSDGGYDKLGSVNDEKKVVDFFNVMTWVGLSLILALALAYQDVVLYVSSGRHNIIQLRHRQPSVHTSRPSLVSDRD
jgi:hypothetical protein